MADALRSARVVLVLGTFLLGHLAPAAASAQALGLREAIAEAQAASPTLRAPSDSVQLAKIDERRVSAQAGLQVVPNFGSAADPFGLTRHSLGLGVSKRLPTGATVSVASDWYRYATAGGNDGSDAGYSVSLSQPLLRGFWTTANADRDTARRAVSGSERALEDARQELVVRVTRAYFEVMRQGQLVDATARSRDRATELRAQSDARARVGLATQLDVLRADLLLSQSESGWAVALESLEDARDALKGLIGRSPDEALEIAGSAELEVDADGIELQDAVGAALASRLDLQEARQRVADAERTAKLAGWNRLPPVTLDVRYTRRGLGGTFLEPYERLWNGWHVGLSTSYALDRASETAATARAQLAVDAARDAAAEVQRQVVAAVRAAHRAWLRASTNIRLQEQAVAIAEKQRRLAELRFERGLDGNFDVIDADTNLLQAQSALAAARIDRVLSRLQLSRAMGVIEPGRFPK